MANSLEQPLDFVIRSQTAKIHYKLDCVRDAILVVVPTPSKHDEVEFFADGHIESQTFGPAGSVGRPGLMRLPEPLFETSAAEGPMSQV